MDAKLKIVYIHNEAEEIGGTSLSLYNMLRSLSPWVEAIIVLRSYGAVYDFFVSNNYECIVVPFRFNYISIRGFLSYFCYIPKLVKNRYICARAVKILASKLRDRHVDLIHTNSSVVDIGLPLAELLSKPHFWHIREFVDLGLKIRPIGSYSSWIKEISKSDQVIAISESLCAHLRRHYPLTKDNLTVLYDAVIPAKPKSIIYEKEKYFLFLSGRIHPIKNPELAVKAFSLSSLAAQGYKLKFVGRCSKEYKKILLELAGNEASSLVFEDFCADVEREFSKASAFLMCSEYEGLGRVSIEAMYYGCPVFALKSGASLDLVQDEITGYLYEDAESCAKKMIGLSSQEPKATKAILDKAQCYVLEHFTEEIYGKRLMLLYNKCIDDRLRVKR